MPVFARRTRKGSREHRRSFAWYAQRSANLQDHERSRRFPEVKICSVTGCDIGTSGCGSQRSRSQD
eukprot:1123667-Pyramimonas_sp.AAC.1